MVAHAWRGAGCLDMGRRSVIHASTELSIYIKGAALDRL